jgi:hypothetical protein
MSRQFKRNYIFKAGIGNNAFETSDLHISFNVEKADTETPNNAKISLWNLSKNHIGILNEKDCGIALYAGYDGNNSMIFAGAVSQVENSTATGDIQTDIEAVDGRIQLRDTHVSLSYNGTTNTQKIYSDIAYSMGLTAVFGENTAFSNISNGFSNVGTAKQALDKICGINGNVWSIQNGILQIKKKGSKLSSLVYVLSAESGLVGVPKRLTEGAENDSDTVKYGWEVDFLLNGAIGVSDFVKLESNIATGYFMVHSVEFNGDNLSGDWLCHAKLYEA